MKPLLEHRGKPDPEKLAEREAAHKRGKERHKNAVERQKDASERRKERARKRKEKEDQLRKQGKTEQEIKQELSVFDKQQQDADQNTKTSNKKHAKKKLNDTYTVVNKSIGSIETHNDKEKKAVKDMGDSVKQLKDDIDEAMEKDDNDFDIDEAVKRRYAYLDNDYDDDNDYKDTDDDFYDTKNDKISSDNDKKLAKIDNDIKKLKAEYRDNVKTMNSKMSKAAYKKTVQKKIYNLSYKRKKLENDAQESFDSRQDYVRYRDKNKEDKHTEKGKKPFNKWLRKTYYKVTQPFVDFWNKLDDFYNVDIDYR